MNADKELPARPSLAHYEKAAKELLNAFRSADAGALRWIRRYHPRLPGRPDTNERNKVTDSQLRRANLSLADAQFVIAREHQFESWPKFAKHLEALNQKDSPVAQFEAAVDAVVTGDVTALKRLLRQNPELIRARSAREHHATLLHYVGANAVEGYHQKTPRNAVKVAQILLKAGAEVDADLDYGPIRRRYPERVGSTTLGLVATSVHPAKAGVQLELLQTLLKAGGAVNGLPGGWNPLVAALHNGRGKAAEFLARRGAHMDLEGAAGVGRLDIVKSFFKQNGTLRANATREQMESGFTWACEYGRTRVVAFLLERGMDVGAKPHGETGLHWAGYGGHADIVKLLLARKAPVDVKDERHAGTPLGWALYGWCNPPLEAKRPSHYEVVALLVRAGAKVDPQWLTAGVDRPQMKKLRADPRMLAALQGEAPRSSHLGHDGGKL